MHRISDMAQLYVPHKASMFVPLEFIESLRAMKVRALTRSLVNNASTLQIFKCELSALYDFYGLPLSDEGISYSILLMTFATMGPYARSFAMKSALRLLELAACWFCPVSQSGNGVGSRLAEILPFVRVTHITVMSASTTVRAMDQTHLFNRTFNDTKWLPAVFGVWCDLATPSVRKIQKAWRRRSAAIKIQRAWRKCNIDPTYLVGRNLFMHYMEDIMPWKS